MSSLEHRRIDLTAAEWQRLDELAVLTRSRPTRGTAAYQPSWRTLIKRIAQGELDVVECEPYQLPPGLDEAIAANEERQREQAQREEQRRRIITYGKQAQKTPVKMEQLNMELEPA